jgi:GDPmannose 4,6-dehydratase
MKTALITGITGQDGSYLAELLLEKGYTVYGLIRRSSSIPTVRINHIYKDRHDDDCRLFLHYGDMTDAGSLTILLNKIQPDEVYNLAAQSHVRVSFDTPVYTSEVVAIGTLNLLEAIRYMQKRPRLYQASSSEMYGGCTGGALTEDSRFRPRSPYAAAKVFSHNMTVNYREAYGLHASCGILFNHESPRRGETFVTRKVTRACGRILTGAQKYLHLGNLESYRDWGYAKEYVEAMWLMLQQDEPDDYVVATGKAHTVWDFVDHALRYSGAWTDCGPGPIRYDPQYDRPTEVDYLLGCADKAKEKLGWKPKVGH